MAATATTRLVSAFTRLFRDQNGQVVIYFTIMVPVMMGLVGLSLEGGRLLMLHSQLQDLADAAALAGAKELDGGDDAMCRAKDKAQNLLTNPTWWSNVASGVNQIKDPPDMVFYSALAGEPTNNPAAADVTVPFDCTNGANVAYIKVVTVNRGVLPSFLIAVGATDEKDTSATATAGSTFVACNVQPLMLCNPFGATSFQDSVQPGDLFGFTQSGNNTGFATGTFNLLDPVGQTHSGAPDVAALLSQSSPNFCFADDVSPHTGNASGPISRGINVRFDIQPNGQTAGFDLHPAPNVIKGYTDPTNACKNNPTISPADALPVNTGMTQVGSIWDGGTFDITNANAYWQYHHGANWPTDASGNPISRYAAYQLERGLSGTPPTWQPNTESPAPICSGLAAETDDRRMVSVAIVNCTPPLSGNSTPTIRSNAYANFFLTRPVDTGSSTTPPYPSGIIWTEFVEMITPQSANGKLHQVVQLYRDQ